MIVESDSESPPWEALCLVGQQLDPKSLAAASGVSKSWLLCLSSDHLWEPYCSAAFPSLHLHHGAASVSYRRLYALGHSAARRRLRKLPKPALSLESLLFALSIETPEGPTKTVLKPCGSHSGLFRFDLNLDVDHPEVWRADALDGVRVTWHVVLRGWTRVFCVMECKGKGRGTGWLSEELPSPGTTGSGLVAEISLRVGSVGEGHLVVDQVSVGVLSMNTWSYVTLDDALSYLQHFLS